MRLFGDLNLFLLTVSVFDVILTEANKNGQCDMSAVPLDPNYNENLLIGTWVIYRDWNIGVPLYDMVLDIQRGDDGNVFYDEHLRDDPTAECALVWSETIYPNGEPGDYMLGSGGRRRAMMMEVKRNYLIFFWCQDGEGDHCYNPDFEVHIRKGHKMNMKLLHRRIDELIQHTCVTDPDKYIQSVIREPCGPDGKGKGKGQ